MTPATRRRTSLAAVVLLMCCFATGTSAQPIGAMKVDTVYDISFNGLSIGDFQLNTNMGTRDYSMTAKANISVLGGMVFEWKATTRSSGTVTAGGPRPSAYSFAYQTSDKKEQIDLKFTSNTVSQITLNPPRRSSSKQIPITQTHLQNVLDPLSAVVQLSQARTQKQKSSACDKRLQIFDGKARYDLVFSSKGTKQLDESGYKGVAYVCRVKYVPIAGHKAGKKDDENELAAANDNIEIWMIPVPDADIFIPYYISVPTSVGKATMTASKFDLTLPSQVKKSVIN
ncbi:MAG: DUF3108 domain-containing protein [Hyphomicrobiales bacterium]|nr:DUF3108 domain-containing protein [Hyphomicrobiales bacterium]